MNTLKAIDGIKKMQSTIDALLKVGSLTLKGDSPKNSWVLEPLHQGKSCSIGFVHIDDIDAGPCEEHIHIEAREYLIVVSGSIMLNVNGKDVRILESGDCGSINPGELHYSRPLEPGTKLAYICVPADAGMDSLFDSMEKK